MIGRMSKSTTQEQVSHMFNAISAKYDRVNRVISLGIDRSWRKAMIRHLPGENLHLLDCATGTCDQLLSMMQSGKIEKAVGVDLAEEMLAIGEKKVAASPYGQKIELLVGNALNLPLDSETFDCITITFGIRNVQGDPLPEMLRVLKPGGRILILEFSLPRNRMIRTLHLFYLRKILPRLGGLISGNAEAYHYLNQTIESFPYGEAFLNRMKNTGFQQLQAIPLSFGVATLYIGEKA